MDEVKRDGKGAYSLGDFFFYTCLLAVPFLTAVVGIFRHSVLWAVLYGVFSVGAVAVLLRFFCTRCPHYTRQGRTLKCIFFWGFPKLFAPRGGAYDRLDLAVVGLATAAFVAFPVYWLLQQPGLFAVYLLSFAGLGAAVYRNECRQCVHARCPMNRTDTSFQK